MQSMALVMIATSEGSRRRVTYSLAVYPCTACICQLIGSDVCTQFVASCVMECGPIAATMH